MNKKILLMALILTAIMLVGGCVNPPPSGNGTMNVTENITNNATVNITTNNVTLAPDYVNNSFVHGYARIYTDKTEYFEGGSVEVTIENNFNDTIYLENCNPVVLMKKKGIDLIPLEEASCGIFFLERSIKPNSKVDARAYYAGNSNYFSESGIYKVKTVLYFSCSNFNLSGSCFSSGFNTCQDLNIDICYEHLLESEEFNVVSKNETN